MLKEVVLALPAGGCRQSTDKLEWWRKEDVALQEVAIQALSLNLPWVQGFQREDLGQGAVYSSRRVGPFVTLALLVAAKQQPARQTAIVKAALAFQLFGAVRRAVPVQESAREHLLQAFARELYEQAGFPDGKPVWLPVHTCVLPEGENQNKLSRLLLRASTAPSSTQELDAALTQVAQALTDTWQAVLIRPARDAAEDLRVRAEFEANPLVPRFNGLVQGMLVERDRLAADHAFRARRRRSAEARELRELRSKHPRWGQWRQLPDAELKSLVWQKQLTALADEFGVTDTAIRKRCDARGIERPPQGYWLRGAHR